MKPAIFLVLILIFFSTCNKTREIKIGFLMGASNSTRWETDMKLFEEKIKELKGTAIIRTADGNEETQWKQALELIDMGIDVLVVVASNVNNAAAIVREAHKKNIKVIAYDRLIKNCDLDYFVGFDNIYTGKLQAQYAIEKKPKGNYVIICGDKGDMNAQYIEQGQMSGLAEKINNGDIHIIYKVFIDGWSPDDARHEIERVIKLNGKKIDAILTANDGTASGASEALNKYGLLQDVIITGLDAELAACRRIVKNEQSMTVYSPIKDLAQTSALLAMELAQNKLSKHEFATKNNGRIEVPSIVLKAIPVDALNLEATIIKDGVYSRDEIFKSDN